ncbi:unnamed protein product [Ectocarpus sp. 8 AP-2014]
MLVALNSHERDGRIGFEEEGHKYFVDGVPALSEGYVSTTTLIHSLFPKFDADVVITKMRASSRWEESKYYGFTSDHIKQMWEKSGKDAAAAGTAMHHNLELCQNGLPHDTASKEFQLFSAFTTDNPALRPFRTEWLIFDEDSRITGSVDMVYTDDDGRFFICDFKRSKDIKRSNRWQKGCSPMTSDLDDCNFNHYSLQLGIYKAILEKNYGIKISSTFLLVLHPAQPQYIEVSTACMSRVVSNIMNWRVSEMSRERTPGI